GAGIAPVRGAQVQGMRAAVTLPNLPTGILVIALRHPATHSGLEVEVLNQVRPPGREYFDVVHQTFAGAEQNHLQRIGRAAAVVKHAGELDVGPGALGGFIAVRPTRRQAMITARVNKLQAASAAMGPLAPSTPRP